MSEAGWRSARWSVVTPARRRQNGPRRARPVEHRRGPVTNGDERQRPHRSSDPRVAVPQSRKGTGKPEYCKQCDHWIVEVDTRGHVVHIRSGVTVGEIERYDGLGDPREQYPRVTATCRCRYLNSWPCSVSTSPHPATRLSQIHADGAFPKCSSVVSGNAALARIPVGISPTLCAGNSQVAHATKTLEVLCQHARHRHERQSGNAKASGARSAPCALDTTVDREERTRPTRSAGPAGMDYWLGKLDPERFAGATEKQRLDAVQAARRATTPTSPCVRPRLGRGSPDGVVEDAARQAGDR